jgi:transposase InsO family protein
VYVLAVIEHASRRIRIVGATAHPSAGWVTQAAKNLARDVEDTGSRARFLIRDRDGKFLELVDAVVADAGIAVVLSGVRMPRMNSIMERWVQTGPPQHTKTRPPRWHSRRIRARRVTCTNEVLGKSRIAPRNS